MGLFPVFLKMKGRKCLVVGAGEVAESKIEGLLASEAEVTVVAPEAKPEIAALAQQGRLQWHRREFVPSDLTGMFLVVTATNRSEVNACVYREATRSGIICNAVDDPPNCDFYFPSIVNRGSLQIAISTAGQSPALAQQLRQEIDEQLPQDLGQWLDSLGKLRREVLGSMPAGEARKQLLHELAKRQVCDLEQCPSRRLAKDTVESSKTSAGNL